MQHDKRAEGGRRRGADGGRESETSSGACQTINIMEWAQGSWWHKKWVDIFSIERQLCPHTHTVCSLQPIMSYNPRPKCRTTQPLGRGWGGGSVCALTGSTAPFLSCAVWTNYTDHQMHQGLSLHLQLASCLYVQHVLAPPASPATGSAGRTCDDASLHCFHWNGRQCSVSN